MTPCSRRHTVISLGDVVHLPRGTATARCDECGQLILVGAVPKQERPSLAEPLAWIVFGLAVAAVLVRELCKAVG